MKAPSPKHTKCKFCRRLYTARGVKEHERHHCAKNPNRRTREFKKSQCRHCGKVLHGNGLRAHVAQVHPEAYARSRSVKAHRMKEKRSGSAGASKEQHKRRTKSLSNHALPSREGSPATRKEDQVTHPHHQPETHARIWDQARKRTPLPTQESKASGNWRRRDQENA